MKKKAAKKKSTKKAAPASEYTRKVVKEIRDEARRIGIGYTPNSRVRKISHIIPRAYCVAKDESAPYYAVFAVPPVDREPQVSEDVFVSIRDKSAKNVSLGDWCALAYVCTDTCGGPIVVKNYSKKK